MASRADLLQQTRQQRLQREAQRQRDAEQSAELGSKEAAAQVLQRVFRGSAARRRWLGAEWASLQKQVHDLENLSAFVREKGQLFVVPVKVLLPLLARARRQCAARAPEETAPVCARLAGFAAACLRAPLADTQRGLCYALGEEAASLRAAHMPDPCSVLLGFSTALLVAALRSTAAASVAELADMTDIVQWAQGLGAGATQGCRSLAARMFQSVTRTSYWPARNVSAAAHLRAWRSAASGAMAGWQGGRSPLPPRAAGLVGIAVSWLRCAAFAGPGASACMGELAGTVLSVAGIGHLLAARVSVTADTHGSAAETNVPWAPLLAALAARLRGAGAGTHKAAGAGGSVWAQDLEYGMVYTCGNLWQINAHVCLPLEELLDVQVQLVNHLEASMLPGFCGPCADEAPPVLWLKEQMRLFSDPYAISQLLAGVLHLGWSTSAKGALSTCSTTAYQRHCLAVAMQEVNIPSALNCCRVYSSLLLKAHVAVRASTQATQNAQVYHGIANTIAYMEGGAVSRVLWRLLVSLFDMGALTPDGMHILHLVCSTVTQLLGVMSPEELRGPGGPLCGHDIARFVSQVTQVCARLIWNDATTSGGGEGVQAQVSDPGDPALAEAVLVHGGRALALLHGFSGRLGGGQEGRLPPETWHCPVDVLSAFRRAMESSASPEVRQRFQLPSERLLRHLPHSVPFDVRVALLRSLIQARRAGHQGMPAQRMVVRRTHLFEDGLAALAKADWRARFEVVFVNAAGTRELGQDIGGLFKEFWEKLAETAFNPDYGLFRCTESRLLYPSPEAHLYHDGTDRLFQFLGLVIGKAIFEGIVVEPCFAPFFLAKLLGRRNSYYDMQTLDPSMFANLQRLKTFDGDVADLCCSFVASGYDGKEVPLLPNGENITVTSETRFRYIYLLSDYKLNIELKAGSSAFLSGFQALIEERWLRMFGEEELQQIISGTAGAAGMDVDDLRKNTKFMNCGPREKVVSDLFKALSAMEPSQQMGVLRFVTSCSRTPLLGFGHMVPPFTLVKVDVRSDADKLPTASTCFNTLKLPTYSSWKVTKSKLVFVAEQGLGFELE